MHKNCPQGLESFRLVRLGIWAGKRKGEREREKEKAMERVSVREHQMVSRLIASDQAAMKCACRESNPGHKHERLV